MAKSTIAAVGAPPLKIPLGRDVCGLSIIDTTCILTVPGDTLVQPPILGHELMNFPTLAFLISNLASGRQLLFDLGCKKDFWNLPPPTAETINTKVPGIKVNKNLSEILVEGGFDVTKLEAAIVSHHHYDHFGDPNTFPTSMELLVGPGFTDNFLPGFPATRQSPFYESDMRGRVVRELSFSNKLMVAGYRAIDYFEDGSLYILDTPGHAIGHLSAMVRTTLDSFVFLGGDICHFGGSFRPTPFVPMPEWLDPRQVGHSGNPNQLYHHSVFTSCHPDQDNARTVPYYEPCCRSDSWYVNPESALESINQLKTLDADENILVLIAHDPAALQIVTFFPQGTANCWREKGWKEALRWRFLRELPSRVREVRYLVDGTYMNGERVKTLDGSRV